MDINATLFGQIISFALFVFFCAKYVCPPILTIIEQRQQEIRIGFEQAEKGKKLLAKTETEIAFHLEQAKAEVKSIITQAEKTGEQIVIEAENSAKKKRKEILAKAHAEINAEIFQARAALKNEISILAMQAAKKILIQNVDKNINKDMIKNFTSQL